MILSRYIEILESLPRDQKVKKGLGKIHSWRGSYNELSLEIVENATVGEMLDDAKNVVGKTLIGYKGGEYLMGLHTNINIDSYGMWTDGRAMYELLFDLLGIELKEERFGEDVLFELMFEKMFGDK